MSDCPFCQRIIDDNYYMCPESTGVVRFEPLNPVTPGHMLFVPTTHITHADRLRGWEAVADIGRAMSAAARWGRQQGEGGIPEQYNLITSNGPDATQTVPHIHIHYVPRRTADGLHLPWTGQIKEH